MRPIRRAVHLDFHTMPGIYDFNREWDPKEFAIILKEANVGYVNAFARCNIGFAYYPTKIGNPYPGMKGDMFGDLLSECHKLDIGVSAYINVGLDHEQSSKNMGWLRLDREGRVIRGDRAGNFFRTLCYNNSQYRDYHFGMLKEICTYDVDGLFFDCMAVEPCYCYHCLKKMEDEGIHSNDVTENMMFQERSMLEFAEESKKVIGENKYLYLNGLHYIAAEKLDTHIEVECLPSAWGYDYFWPYASYARNIQKKVLYMTGRFQSSWGDFGGFKQKASLENDYYDALCAGVGVSIGDHMHPAGNLDRGIYKVVGELNAMVKALEPYTEKTEYLAEIGILVNSQRPYHHEFNAGAFLSQSYSGITRMFGEMRYSYDIINENMPMEKYRVIVLPDSIYMNDTLKNKLASYLENGGKILSTGTAGLNNELNGFALPQWNFTFESVDKSNASYFHILENDDPKLTDMDYSMYSESGILFQADIILASYVKAYFEKHWDGFHGFYYTPPEKETKYAAAAINEDSSVCHISFDIFKSYYKNAAYASKSLVQKCLKLLLPKPLIITQHVPSTARVTAARCSSYTLLHVKVTYPEVRGRMNIIEEHVTLGAGAVVYIKGNYKSACTLPEKEPIDVEAAFDGYAKVILPEITGYKAIMLENQQL